MAEQFLTLMADLSDEAQVRMSGWYQSLQEAGFTGVQTPGLPYHISLATFPLDQEKEAAEIARKAAAEFAPVPVHLSHIGMFAGGKVLFAAPEKDAELSVRRAAAVSVDAPRHHPDRRTGNSLCGIAGFRESLCSFYDQDHPAASVRVLADAGGRIIYAGRKKVRL